MSVQDHIHLQALTGGAESGIYHIKQMSLDDTPTIPMTIDRALNSTLWYHRVLDTSGLPVIISNQSFTLINMTVAQKEALFLLAARPIYYIPVDHSATGDSAGHTVDRQTILLAIKPGSVTSIDPIQQQYWQASVEITNA